MSAISYDTPPGRRRKRRPAVAGPVYARKAFGRDLLYSALVRIREKGGPAAGLEGFSPRELSPDELQGLADALAKRLRAGPYVHGPTRTIPVPKGLGRGERLIEVANLADRAVGLCLTRALRPHWDAQFLPEVFGFRPGRGTWDAVDRVKRAIENGCPFVAKADIKDAFGNVPAKDVLEAHEKLPKEVWSDRWGKDSTESNRNRRRNREWVLRLMAAVLAGGQAGRRRGISQGGTFSPLALNIVLHDAHDRPLREAIGAKAVWARYVDDIAYVADSRARAEATHKTAAGALRKAGYEFKKAAALSVTDVREQDFEFLGYTLRQNSKGVVVGVGPSGIDHLRENLKRIRCSQTEPGRRAAEVLTGWAGYYVPVGFEDVTRIVIDVALEFGFAEVPLDRIRRAFVTREVELKRRVVWRETLERTRNTEGHRDAEAPPGPTDEAP